MSDWPELEQRLVDSARGRVRRRWRRGPIVLAPAVALAAAAAVFLLPSERPGRIPADERPVATPTASPYDEQEAERRAFKSPAPAPAGLAAAYSALADGKLHAGPKVAGATVTVHGSRRGGCIWMLPDGALGPGGSCFTEQNVNAATGLWQTSGGTLLVLVPDTATDITIEAPDGTRRPATATSNVVAADHSDTVRYSDRGKRMAVAAAG